MDNPTGIKNCNTVRVLLGVEEKILLCIWVFGCFFEEHCVNSMKMKFQ